MIRTLYDPTCGTGGFLTDAMNHVGDYGNRDKIPPVLVPHGQELEPETHAVCVAGMLIRRLESDHWPRSVEEHSSGQHAVQRPVCR